MRYLSILFLLLIAKIGLVGQQTYIENEGEITFYSYALIEDIEATNKKVSAAIDLSTGELVVKMYMVDFHFDKSLMEEHFNENYIESDKYPTAIFQGKISTEDDLTQDGSHTAKITGKITLHGVTKLVETDIQFIKSGDNIKASTKFKIKTADHNIKIPKIVFKNIAKVIDVTVTLSLSAAQ